MKTAYRAKIGLGVLLVLALFSAGGLFSAMAMAGALADQAPALLQKADVSRYQAAFKLARQGKWIAARRRAAAARDPLLRRVVDWLYLKNTRTRPGFAEITAFIKANRNWPGLDKLRRRAERRLDRKTRARDVIAWFGVWPPLTGDGASKYAESLIATGRRAEGIALLRQTWRQRSLSLARERQILRRHGRLLRRQDHVARLDAMLWAGLRGEAARAIRRAPVAIARLGRARLALMRRAGNVDAAIARVSPALQNDPGLIYERIRWRRRKGKFETAQALLDTVPGTPAAQVRPEKWWYERRVLARRALADGRLAEAYHLIANHGLLYPATLRGQGEAAPALKRATRAKLAEAEWTAGWIALNSLGEAGRAYNHFRNTYQVVRRSISIARAATASGRADEAIGWYRTAARYSTTYYGQLAATTVGASLPVPYRPASAEDPGSERFTGGKDERVRIALELAQIGAHRYIKPFFRSLLAAAETSAGKKALALLALSIDRLDLAHFVTRAASRDDDSLLAFGFPEIPLKLTNSVEPALVYAMVRQESAFDVAALSHVGARGLMQLSPGTARDVARRLGLRYSRSRLSRDAAYNLKLGSTHIEELIATYRGSYLLALAAYNAGEGPVNRWLRVYGDPRKGVVDPVDWIELIPYSETRDYVQRVLEGVQVYRQQLEPGRRAPGLRNDLTRAMVPAPPAPRPRLKMARHLSRTALVGGR